MNPLGTESRPSAAWRPAAEMRVLRARARLLERIRAFFAARGVLEVETAALSPASPPDPSLEPFCALYRGPGSVTGTRVYLQSSPELAMKRLLAADSGPIYQICKVFRNGELGRVHNPEFTMLEWYRPGFDHHRLMDEVEDLLQASLSGLRTLSSAERISYRELFRVRLGVDPLADPVGRLRECARSCGVQWDGDQDEPQRDPWLELLLSHCLQPQLGFQRPTLVYDFPATQAALARIRPDEPELAERFELFVDGMEIANGYRELTDPAEQALRFERDLARRAARGAEPLPVDRHFLAALRAGLPSCAGVALGVDRLLMVASGASSLSEVLAFPFERA